MKQINYIIFLFFIFYFHYNYSQNEVTPTIQREFIKKSHSSIDAIKKVVYRSTGESYLFGETQSDYTNNDILVVKLTVNLDTLWTKKIDIPAEGGGYDIFVNGEVDSQGSSYIYISRKSYFISTYTSDVRYVMKLDNNGNEIFTENITVLFNNITTDYTQYFSHLDFNDNFVIINDQNNPSPQISFLKFLPNNTYQLTHRNDLIEMTDGALNYFNRFFYLNGQYYYVNSKAVNSYSNYQHTINKVLPIGHQSVNISPVIGTLQIHGAAKTKELHRASNGTLYYAFYGTSQTPGYNAVVINPDFTIAGHYLYTPAHRRLLYSYVMPNNNLKIISEEIPNSGSPVSPILSEQILTPNGTTLLDTLYPNITGKVRNIDVTKNYINDGNNLKIVDNQWNLIHDFNGEFGDILNVRTFNQNTFIYSNKLDYMSEEDQVYPDQIEFQVQKYTGNTLESTFNYNGEGTTYTEVEAFLRKNDGSYLVYYSAREGNSYQQPQSSYQGTYNGFIKKFDANFNEVWEIRQDHFLFNSFRKDANDFTYFITYSITPVPDSAPITNYHLKKIDANGQILFSTSTEFFKDYFIVGDYIYVLTTHYLDSGFEYKVLKYNKNTGALISSQNIPEQYFLASYVSNTNDIYLYYENEEYVNSIGIKKVKLYKNFNLHHNFTIGANEAISGRVVDPSDGSIFFNSYNTSNYTKKIFKLTTTNQLISKNISQGLNPALIVNNCLILSGQNTVGQFNKNNLNTINQINHNISINKFFNAGNHFIAYDAYNKIAHFYTENLEPINQFPIKNTSSIMDYNNSNQLVSFDYTHSYPQIYNVIHKWKIANLWVYDINPMLLSNDNFEIQQTDFKVYPNPTADWITITSKNETVVNINVFDLNGKHLKSASSNQINLENLATGIYIIQYQTSNGMKASHKIIKK